jgi:glycosyltransferase involved in cell wall biosynthesis
MKFLLINYELPPIGGGAGNATWEIAKAFVTLGHEAHIITTAFGDRTMPTVIEGIRIHPIPAVRRKPDRSNVLEMAMYVGSALRRSPAIVRSQNIEAVIVFFTLPCGLIAYRLKKKLGIPYVISMQGGDVPNFVPSLNLIHCMLTPFRRNILSGALAAVANSPGLRNLSLRSDPFDIKVVPNGIDVVFFSPQDADSITAGPFKILFAGRFHDQKNLPMLMRAIGYLSRKLNGKIELHLVGDGPQKHALERLAAALEISEKTFWHGWVDKLRLRDLYRTTDCFVNPSTIEGMPNTVLEAMACGKPVVASDVAGNQDLVVHGTTGFLFTVNNDTALTTHLLTLIHDRALVKQLGANARERAVGSFSWKQTAQAYCNFF